jgi:hypothetical protein
METYQKENREMKVEFITKDKGSYQPKTTSWGVFERPDNISEAYGGGRNIEPGAPLESDAASQARLAKVRQAVGNFRRQTGLDVEPESEAEVSAALAEGEAALSAGVLDAAAVRFRAAAALAPLPSAQGGQARLRLALCLDSMGQAAEAKELYTMLGRHPNAEVKKQAARLLWGMTEATAFLKVDGMTFDDGRRREYARYFDSQVNPWENAYVGEADAAEAQALQRAGWAAMAALAALPAGLLLALRSLAEAQRAAAGMGG